MLGSYPVECGSIHHSNLGRRSVGDRSPKSIEQKKKQAEAAKAAAQAAAKAKATPTPGALGGKKGK
jgi:hypothetical protein